MEENKNETVAEAETVTPKDEASPVEESTAEETVSRGEKKQIKKLERELEETKKTLADAKSECDAANDKYVRLFAEYDNFRKRSAKEREGIYGDAYVDALTQILPILDNLERAVAFRGEGEESELAKGLELTLKSFVETLNKMGVYEIEAMGKSFDPNLHNAVMHVDDESFGENEVVEVLMKGYIRGDKVLRYSMVKVAN